MDPALVEVVSTRANPGIDPVLHIWGWEVPVYLFLGGVVAGLMVLLPLLEWRDGKPQSKGTRLAPFAAIALISLGMGALFLDLENKLHVFRFYLAFVPASPMSWGSWLLILVYPALLMLGLGSLDADTRMGLLARVPRVFAGGLQSLLSLADRERRPILVATAVGGVGLGMYTGLLLGTLVARPMWNSALLGPLFLTSGISTGAALLMLMPLQSKEHHSLARWDTMAIAVELVLLTLLLIDLSGGAVSSAAVHTLLGGSWTPVFWSLVIVGGLAVPLLLNGLELGRRLSPTLYAPVLVLIGGLALRWVLVAAGQESGVGMLP
jgi:protein NrfD